MAAKEDGENASQEGDQRIVDLALQAVWVRAGTNKVAKVAKMEGRTHGRKGSGKKGSKGQEKGGKGDSREMLDVWQDRTHCSMVQERRQQKCVRHR